MRFLNRSIRQARRRGFRLRPSQSVIRYRPQWAKTLRRINRRLANRCRFNSVQPAINRSGNNDRVVIMPGRYVEKRARDMPVDDPRCADMTQTDGRGRQAPSYEYQVSCPHDQNLIYVQGREIGDTPPPDPPLEDRHGIPDLGDCVRCNLQVEGSGVKPEDVILDAGTDYQPLGQVAAASGRQAAMGPRSKPGGYAKDVVLRVDRADGFVGRNFLVRGAEEHGFYTEETDGALLDRVKVLLEPRLRPPQLPQRPPRDPQLPRVRERRRGRLSGRVAGDRLAGAIRLLPRRPALQHGGAQLRHASQRARLLRLDG
jgi:hypothetical protein